MPSLSAQHRRGCGCPSSAAGGRAVGAAPRPIRARSRVHKDHAQPDGVLNMEIKAGESYGFFTDTSVCIGCKACEVACKEWNQLEGNAPTFLADSFDNTGQLDAQNWRHVQFIETIPRAANGNGGGAPVIATPTPAGGQAWLMLSD